MSPLALAVIGPTILTTTNDIDQDVPTAAAAMRSAGAPQLPPHGVGIVVHSPCRQGRQAGGQQAGRRVV